MSRSQHHQRAGIADGDLAKHVQQQRLFAIQRVAGDDDRTDVLALQCSLKDVDDGGVGVRLHFKFQIAADMHVLGGRADLYQAICVFVALRQERQYSASHVVGVHENVGSRAVSDRIPAR